jgi:hypothetical protein
LEDCDACAPLLDMSGGLSITAGGEPYACGAQNANLARLKA